MVKAIMAFFMISCGLLASPPIVDETGEEARVFTLVDYQPVDISVGCTSNCVEKLTGDYLAIFKTIRRYWENKTTANLANKTDSQGWGEISFVVLIKGNTARFSTRDNTGGSLASGVVLNKLQEDSLGVLKKKNGKWLLVKREGPEFLYGR